jgi:hypothetical protein
MYTAGTYVGFVCTKNKQGRPRKEVTEMNCQMEAKRTALGAHSGLEQLTGLHYLYIRKQLSKEQFIAGNYYTQLCAKLRKSLGNISGQKASAISRIDHIPGIPTKEIMLNQDAVAVQSDLNEIIGYVHDDALNIVTLAVNEDCMESAQFVRNLSFTKLGIFRKTLDVIFRYIQENSISIEQYYKIA